MLRETLGVSSCKLEQNCVDLFDQLEDPRGLRRGLVILRRAYPFRAGSRLSNHHCCC
jgi:hypothetical protein